MYVQDDSYQDSGGIANGWSLTFNLLTPPQPTLSVTRSNAAVVISWPSPSTGWALQENTNSVSSADWNDRPYPQDNGTIKYIIVNPPAGNRFYRLKK